MMSIDIFACSNERCRWPRWGYTPRCETIGEAMLFCGAATDGVSPYCAEHHAVASHAFVRRLPSRPAPPPAAAAAPIPKPQNIRTAQPSRRPDMTTRTQTKKPAHEILFTTSFSTPEQREEFRLAAERQAIEIGLTIEEWRQRRAAAADPFVADRHMVRDPGGEMPEVVAQREALKAKHAAIVAARG